MSENKRRYLILTVQSALLVLGIYFFCRYFRNSIYFELIAPVEDSNPALYEGLQYLGHLVFLLGLVIYFAIVKDERYCLKSAAFTRKNKGLLFLLIGLVAGFAMNAAAVGSAILHGDIDMVAKSFSPGMLVFLFVCVFIQAATEEAQCRLWTYNRILNGATLWYAVIGSAIAFAFMHTLNNGLTVVALLNIFLIGVVYALSVKCTGSIWFACGLHAAWNFSQNCIFGLPDSGNEAVLTVMAPTYTKNSFFYDSDFGVEGTLMTVIINLVAVAVMLCIVRRQKKAENQ